MAEIKTKLNNLDEDNLIILVSWNTWEHEFTTELGNTLQTFGGFYVKEFQYQFSRRFSEHTRRRHLDFQDITEMNNYHHPFAFVGIKGLAPGMAYESIRSNQGYFMAESPQPFAELTLYLSYNILTNRYVFDQIQVEKQMRMNEDYKTIHASKNRSLKHLIHYLAAVNLTVDLTALGIGFESTFYDQSILLPGEIPERVDQDGNVLISGVDLKAKDYYTYLQNFVYSEGECQVPYTDLTNDFWYDIASFSGDIPPIFQCKIGLLPTYCPTMTNVENSFSGYF